MLSRLKTNIMQFKWKAPFQSHDESAEVMEMLTEVTEDVPTAKKRWLNEKAQKQLLETLRNDDFEAFTRLLKKDVNVDHVYENQHTLLIEACGKEERGKEARGKEEHGKGPEKYVKALLAANADPNLRDNEGRTALHWAAAESNDKCMQLLLEDSRTNANVRSYLEYTPLHCATLAFWDSAHAGSHARCIQMLMERRDLEVNRPDKFGDPAIWNALQHPEADAAQILKVILKCKHSRLNVDVWHVRNGSTIRKVIETKFPKLKDLLPRLSECETGSGRIMQMLLQPNPNLEEFSSALPEDIDKRFEDPYYCTPLELACRRKDLQGFVKVLLDAKANPEQSTEIYDFPVLHQAMANGNFDALKTMISYNVDFGIKTSSQHTEEELEMEKCVNLVLGREDDKSSGGGQRDEAAVAVAAAADARPLVDVHARDGDGDTALHDAAQYGQQHVALPLLRSGANVLLRNDDQRTPLDLLDPATLRVFLDEHVRGSGRPRSDDYQITMRYKFLVSQDKNIPEIETAYHISRSRHLQEDIVENAIAILSDKNQATDMDLVMNLLNTLTEEIGKCQKGREERK
ncbi:Uncharacterized protein GBIM_01266 [Gryllus bimaculatus]|nr:Uncharacterized protein GBIM_01266 [Gryllus bimaculatus]